MKNIQVFLFLCFAVFGCSLVFASRVHAEEEFFVNLNSEYKIDSQGKTEVTNVFTIKNKYSTVFAGNYSLEINSANISNIIARSSTGEEYQVEVQNDETKTTLTVHFPDKMLGKDKERTFFISYQIEDIASLFGQILEVNIPKLTRQETIDQYSVSIKVPSSFKRPSFSRPEKYEEQSQDDYFIYGFGEIAREGIRLLFGDRQIFRFTLHYHLNNPSISQGIAQIALPPDTSYQKVAYEHIDPIPDKIESDADGNWIATFTIAAQKEQEVVASGYVSLYLNPVVQAAHIEPTKQYLAETQFWKVTDPEIQQLAKQTKTPQEIYNFIVKNFKYDYARLALGEQMRQGSFAAFRNPTASLCQDFTDVFIAIARASGIQSREVNGYAHTDNSQLRPLSLVADVLHAWPEYYEAERKQWIPVDPTWGNTTDQVDFFSKLDFNHIVFAIHGLSDDRPFPAGMYKLTGKEEKDVEISVEPENLPASPTLDVELLSPSFTNPSMITVKNNTGVAWYNIPISVVSSQDSLKQEFSKEVIQLLPFQQTLVEIPLQKSLFSLKKHGTISVTIGGKTITYEQSQGTTYPIIGLGIALVGGAAVAGSLLVLGKRR